MFATGCPTCDPAFCLGAPPASGRRWKVLMPVAAFGVESEAELAVLKQSGFNLICQQICIPWLSSPFLRTCAILNFFSKTAIHEQRQTVANLPMIGTDV